MTTLEEVVKRATNGEYKLHPTTVSYIKTLLPLSLIDWDEITSAEGNVIYPWTLYDKLSIESKDLLGIYSRSFGCTIILNNSTYSQTMTEDWIIGLLLHLDLSKLPYQLLIHGQSLLLTETLKQIYITNENPFCTKEIGDITYGFNTGDVVRGEILFSLLRSDARSKI